MKYENYTGTRLMKHGLTILIRVVIDKMHLGFKEEKQQMQYLSYDNIRKIQRMETGGFIALEEA